MIQLRLAIFAVKFVCWTKDKDAEVWNLERCRKTTPLNQKEIHIRWFWRVVCYYHFCDVSTSKANVWWKKGKGRRNNNTAPANDLLQFTFLLRIWIVHKHQTQATHLLEISNISANYAKFVTILNYTNFVSVCPFLHFYFNLKFRKIFFATFPTFFFWRKCKRFLLCCYLHWNSFIYLFIWQWITKRFWMLLEKREWEKQTFGRGKWIVLEKVKRIFIQSVFEILLENITLANKPAQEFKSIIQHLMIWHETVAFEKCWKKSVEQKLYMKLN